MAFTDYITGLLLISFKAYIALHGMIRTALHVHLKQGSGPGGESLNFAFRKFDQLYLASFL